MNEMQQFLHDRDLQQKEFAHVLGYTAKHISGMATGRDPISYAFIGKVLEQYGIGAALLFLPVVGRKLNGSSTTTDGR